MRRLILGLVVLGLCLTGADAYCHNITISLYEPGFTYEVIDQDIGSPMGGLSATPHNTIDNDGNMYVKTSERTQNIWKIDKECNVTHFATIQSLVNSPIERIDFDNINGVMYCLVVDSSPTGLYLVKISGFTPLYESQPILDIYNTTDGLQYQIQGLQTQIDNIQLIPGPIGPQGEQGPQGEAGPQGPKGDPGITPAEVAAMQQMINENRYLLQQLPQLKKELEALQSQAK